MSTVTPNLGLFKYDTTNVTDLASSFNIKQALNNNWDIIDNAIHSSGGTSRNIGEIVYSTIPLTDAGLHLLDGSLIQGSGSYSAFVDYIAGLDLTANYFCTEQEWQASVTQYGVCGKFVYDSTLNTVRLPKVTGIIEGTTDLMALGSLVEAGLPPITGQLARVNFGGGADAIGAFSLFNKTSWTTSGSGGTHYEAEAKLDASRSSSIYGNSSTVQPQTIKAFYYIVIATSTKTEIQVDIDEIATDLNGKVSKADCVEVGCVVETYRNGASWYRIYSDGWCEQGGVITSSSGAQAVNLLKTYKDTMYTVVAVNNYKNTSTRRWASAGINTTSQIWIMNSINASENSSTPASWYTCGYIEV